MNKSSAENELKYPGKLKIAVVGAGPAGIYASDILLKQIKEHGEELELGSEVRIDIFEKLPVPFGLVRYGVAPDHPSIKYIVGALEKTLSNPELHLYADVEFGKDITLEDLKERYDAIIFATGANDDQPLTVKGHNLTGVYGAAKFVEWYEGYPYAKEDWPLDAQEVAVIGGGNVAMDISRILMREANDMLSTDIPENVYQGIQSNNAQVLHMFIRRGPAQAKFAVQELRELEKLPGVQIVVDDNDFDLDTETVEKANEDKLTRQMLAELQTIRELASTMADEGGTDYEGQPAKREYNIHFYEKPVEIIGDNGKVTGIRVERTSVDAEGNMMSTGNYKVYPVQAVYHAIGYKPAHIKGIPYDDDSCTLINEGGRLYTSRAEHDGQPIPRLYATGWAKRGPIGLIGSTKSDALETISNMLSDLASMPTKGRIASDRDELSTDRLLASKGLRPVDYSGWKRIDCYEREQGKSVGREHIKVINSEELRRIALDQ